MWSQGAEKGSACPLPSLFLYSIEGFFFVMMSYRLKILLIVKNRVVCFQPKNENQPEEERNVNLTSNGGQSDAACLFVPDYTA